MQKYDLALDKYLVTKSGYFRLATTVTLSLGITDARVLFYNDISEQNRGEGTIMR